MVTRERVRLTGELGSRGEIVVFPSDANFVLFGPEGAGLASAAGGGRADLDAEARRIWQFLLDSGVLVRDCTSWPGLAGCLRVTVGTPAEGDAFMDALDGAPAGRGDDERPPGPAG